MRSGAADPAPSHPMEAAHAYDEGLAVDVVQVQGEDVVLAAHVHAVVVLVLQQDAVIAGVEQEVEEVRGAGGLQLCGADGHTSTHRCAHSQCSPNLCSIAEASPCPHVPAHRDQGPKTKLLGTGGAEPPARTPLWELFLA